MTNKRKIFIAVITLIVAIGGIIVYKYKNRIDMSYGRIEYVQNIKDIKEGLPTIIMFRMPYSDECLEMERVFRRIYDDNNGNLNLLYYNMEAYDNEEVMTAMKNYDVKIAPTMVFINKEGQPKFKEEGILNKDTVVDILKKMQN